MIAPRIEAYSKDPSGMGYGSYSRVPTRQAKYRVEHSIGQGDQLTFQTVTKLVDNDLVTKRPIRFYTGDETKLFDGMIVDVEYELMGNDWKKLTGTASSWWQELKMMDLLKPLVFDNMTPNDMFAELCNIANEFGVMKEAQYVYDTDKIPYYNIFNTAYETQTGTEIVFDNVFQAMQSITAYLDVAELLSPYDFCLRIESLPAGTGETWAINETDVESNIYVIPFVMREDGNESATYKTFKLEAGFDTRKDYRNLCNNCIAVGDGLHTQQLGTVLPLESSSITTNDQWFGRSNQVLGNHYLAITIDNPTGAIIHGWAQVVRVLAPTNPVETFPMSVPAGMSTTRYTTERTDEGLPATMAFRFVDFSGCTAHVEEVTNDAPPYQTTVAGRSIAENGYAASRLENMWIDTQVKADAYAGKMVRLFHNPTIVVDVPILPKYVSYDNVMGKIVDVYSQFNEGVQPFIAMGAAWDFNGDTVSQSLRGVLHQVVWDTECNYNYVVDAASDNVVNNAGTQVIAYD